MNALIKCKSRLHEPTANTVPIKAPIGDDLGSMVLVTFYLSETKTNYVVFVNPEDYTFEVDGHLVTFTEDVWEYNSVPRKARTNEEINEDINKRVLIDIAAIKAQKRA